MPKRLIQQRRGKGSPLFRAPSFRFLCKVGYRPLDELEKGVIKGVVKDILHDPARSAPVMLIQYETGEEIYLPAADGIKVNDIVYAGAKAPISIGCVLPLKFIPTGTTVYNIEKVPGDGGKFVRAAGTCARIVAHEEKRVFVELPSRQIKEFHPMCRATIGVIAGAGRKEKPILKAGKMYHIKKAKGKLGRWPRVSAVAMGAHAHPFGGKRARTGRTPFQVPRNAPLKYGSIAPRRTGKKKK